MAIDPNIKQKAENIRLKKKGREVRESLAAGLEAMSEDVVSTVARQGNVEGQFQEVIDNTTGKDVISAPELIAARNGEANLKARLDKEQQEVNAQLAHKGHKNKVTPEEFDGATDDEKIQKALDYASENKYSVILENNKDYWLENTVWLPIDVSIDFNYARVRTDKNILMLSTKPGEKLINCTFKNLNLLGANDPTFTNNTGIRFASIYGRFENIEIMYCYDGFIQHADNVPGNQVTNIYRDFRIRYNHGVPMRLGEENNEQITDGWLDNINIGADAPGAPYHLRIGSASGYFIGNIHTWGDVPISLIFENLAHTNINGVYIERFLEYAMRLHIKSEVNISNFKTHFHGGDKALIYFRGSATSLYNGYNANFSNFVVGEYQGPLSGLTIFEAENARTINVNLINCTFDLSDFVLNALPDKIKISYGGLLREIEGELTHQNSPLSKHARRQAAQGGTQTVRFPLGYKLPILGGMIVDLDFVLPRFWNQFDTTVAGVGKAKVYLYRSATSSYGFRVVSSEYTGSLTNVIYSFNTNDNSLDVTFTVHSDARGHVIADIK